MSKRFETYWNQREIVVWDTLNQERVYSTTNVNERTIVDYKIIAQTLNKIGV